MMINEMSELVGGKSALILDICMEKVQFGLTDFGT